MRKIKKLLNLAITFFLSINLSSCSFMDDYSKYSKKSDEETKYKITWNDGNGNEIYSDFVNIGEIPEYKSEVVPTKNANTQYSYVFNNNWEPEIVPANRDATYTAQFDLNLNKYSVYFYEGNTIVDHGDYFFGETPVFNGTIETDMEIPEGEREEGDELKKYSFVGWKPEIRKVTSDIKYYAVYNKIPKNGDVYSVTFELDNGEDSIVKYYNSGDKIIYPDNPTKPGYVFLKWSLTVTNMPASNIIIRAIYSLNAPGAYIYHFADSLSTSPIQYTFVEFKSYDSLKNNNNIQLDSRGYIKYCSIESVTYNQYTSLVLPNTIRGFASNAFDDSNLKKLDEVTINTNSSFVFTFEDNCFNNIRLLKKITIEGNGKFTAPCFNNLDTGYPSGSVFNKCYNLESFIMNNKQEVFTTALFYSGPSISTLVLPNTIKRLNFHEFYYMEIHTEQEVLGSTIYSYSYESLYCYSVNTLVLPSSLNNFCLINTCSPYTSFVKFNYKGSMSDWVSKVTTKSFYDAKNPTNSKELNSKKTSLPTGFNITYNN